MMNICESMQGALYVEAAEVVYTLWPKGNESWKEVGQYSFVINRTLRIIVGIYPDIA
ncbi:hypothetical protein [Parashewanella curva]|uniref:hypothetical protein n=1 Tax=Parashewanella curva TaxID=2338552 RepID=UPI001A9F07A9|nr:hypothetical protein [Parashewanella curva]